MTQEQLKMGLDYAERNYFSERSFSSLDKELIKKHFQLRDKQVLDFGCGMGHMSLWFARELGAVVDGVDIDENHITVANELLKKYPAAYLHFSLKNIITDPINKQYDFIFLNDVIEHIKNEWIPQVLDVIIQKNLKAGGVVFFSYPPWKGPHASHLQEATKIPWIQFFPRSYIMKILQKRNLQLVGKKDLRGEYLELNHMTHKKLKRFLKKYKLKQMFRKSHTILNKVNFLRRWNFNFFPFTYIVTKELIAFKKNS